MLKIACVNIDISHPNMFARIMRNNNIGMYYSCLYNDGFRSDDEVNAFMKNNNIKKRYRSLDEMAKNIDVAFIHDCNWEKHIDHLMPFINAGKPVFLDKPIAGNLRDCLKLEELVKKGAVIVGGSSLRYAVELENLKKNIANSNEKIATVYGTSGVDEFNYGVHTMEGIHGLLGPGVYSNTYIGVSGNGRNPVEQYLVKWNTGTQVIYQTQTGVWQPFNFTVTTDKVIHHITINTKRIYLAMLQKIESFLEKNEAMASIYELTETVRIYLAGKKSRELKGQEITLSSLSIDDPGFDGHAFEKKYINDSIKQ